MSSEVRPGALGNSGGRQLNPFCLTGNGLPTMDEVDEDIARYTDENLVIKPEEERKIRRKIVLHVSVDCHVDFRRNLSC